jgi:pimeloyl-ACP methyl ester carboxylesterase
MKRKSDIIRILIAALIIAVHFNCSAQSFLIINGKKVEVITAGLEHNQANKPVIVFENGRGSTFNSWEKVIKEISKESAVFAYNRPRIGKSEDDSIPPTMKHIVDNLRKMLLEKGLKPPYLLVGHSFGAAYIRSFTSYYPGEIAGLIFVDPHDFTKKVGYGRFPYQQVGLTEPQIDSILNVYSKYGEDYIKSGPKYQVEEVKIQGELARTGHEECYRNPLPEVPVHFIQAGGFGISPDEPATIYDREKLFRINSTLERGRWLELLYPLKYGRFFYVSKSGHAVQIDDPELVIDCITLAISDYYKIKKK